jgi:hypothetical protein
MKTQRKVDPLVRAVRLARGKDPVVRLEKLLAEERRWRRRATMALNKQAKARAAINRYVVDFVREVATRGVQGVML